MKEETGTMSMLNNEKKEKILYFLDFPHNVGGSNKVLLTQAYIMNKRGYDTTVVIPNDINGQHDRAYDMICNNYCLNTVNAKFSIAACMEAIDIHAVIESYDEILQIVKDEKPDLIHSTQINIAVEMAARELNIPHLMNVYPTDEDAFVIQWLDIYPHYHSADSELLSNRWSEGLTIPSKCIRVAYAGGCESKQDNTGVLQILSIGVLYNVKNQLEIIKFVLQCKKNGINVSLTFLGDDTREYGTVCKEFVLENNLENEVTFQGFVMNIEGYLQHADLLIHASKMESYPGVLVESMANKVPVLSTPVAGVPEILKDGYNGFLTKGYQSDDIYEAFINYLTYKKEGRIGELIQCAYKTYLENHSLETVGDALESYYNWIWTNYRNSSKRIRINQLREIFTDFIDKEEYEKLDLCTRNSIWYLWHIKNVIRQRRMKNVLIWGAGHFGEIALEWIDLLQCSENFLGFIDSYKTGTFQGYSVFPKSEQIIQTGDLILVAIADKDICLEIMAYLERLGKRRNRDYFLMFNSPIRI